MTMKLRGFIKLRRDTIELEKELTDAEFRLLQAYRRLADWDRRHTTFSTCKVPYRELLRKYLPPKRWSIAKIAFVVKGLISKGWIKRLPDCRILICDPTQVHSHEQAVQPPEQTVQSREREVMEAIQTQRRELGRTMAFPQ